MEHKEYAIGDTAYFAFAANTTAGAAGDGATPLYDVRLCGAAADAAPVASGTPTLLTHANYTDGLHEIAIDTTGYAAGEYSVYCTLTISSVNPAGYCGSFKLRAAGSTTHALATSVVSTLGVAGAGLTALPTAAQNRAEMDSSSTKLAAILAAASSGGTGASQVTITVTDGSSNLVADCEVWITSDLGGTTVVAGPLVTDDNGQAEFLLDVGVTYYGWRRKSGVNFTNPVTFVAAGD